jgi:L-amino acid N-acyltransferase YncA
MKFEELREEHLPKVLAIYTHYVLNSTATFHSKPLTLEEMKAIVLSENPKYPSFVIIEDEGIRGYVILTQYKNREAYDGTAEVTIYLTPDYTGKGIGSLALKHIETVARKNGFHVLLSVICGENGQSIHLFAQNGYTQCAHYNEVGRKFDRWLDVVVYQKILLY